jgi:uncharacterized protein (DUF2461 family)
LREQTVDFLDELEHRNERKWFQEHKPIYEVELTERMLAVIAALNVALAAPLEQKAATGRRRSA